MDRRDAGFKLLRKALDTDSRLGQRDDLLPEFRSVRVPGSRYEKYFPSQSKEFSSNRGGTPA
jgi:hypothetical protein